MYGARMRHLWSLLAGVVAAPLTWCLIALGQSGSQDTVGDWVRNRTFDVTDLVEPAAYLVAAGVVLGLVATLRISPVGPLVGGVLLAAAYIGMFIAPLDVRDAVPDDWEVLDRQLPLRLPLDNGTLLLVGVLLLMAVFSAQRWRRWPAPAPASEEPSPDTEPITTEATLPVVPDRPAPAQPLPTPPSWPTPQPTGESRPPTESPWSAPPQGRPERT